MPMARDGINMGRVSSTENTPFPLMAVQQSAQDTAVAAAREITIAIREIVTELKQAGRN